MYCTIKKLKANGCILGVDLSNDDLYANTPLFLFFLGGGDGDGGDKLWKVRQYNLSNRKYNSIF